MGKLFTYLGILICIDLLLITTGILCPDAGAGTCTLTSSIFAIALDPSAGTVSLWFKTLIGNIGDLLSGDVSPSGLGALVQVVSTVVAGAAFISLKSDSILFIGISISFAVMVGDFVAIFMILQSYNPVLALLTMSPICVLYVLAVLEWDRSKD